MEKLKDKTALVTGGSRGIGAAIAKRLALDGANVAITYHTSADKAETVVQEIRKLGVKAIAIRADSAEPAQVIQAVNQAANEFGRFDILVNNAGIGLYNDIANLALDDFDRIISINVKAVFAA